MSSVERRTGRSRNHHSSPLRPAVQRDGRNQCSFRSLSRPSAVISGYFFPPHPTHLAHGCSRTGSQCHSTSPTEAPRGSTAHIRLLSRLTVTIRTSLAPAVHLSVFARTIWYLHRRFSGLGHVTVRTLSVPSLLITSILCPVS